MDVLSLFHSNLQDLFERAAISTTSLAIFAVQNNSVFDLEQGGCAVCWPMSVSAATVTVR